MTDSSNNPRAIPNMYVTTMQRDQPAIRIEIVGSAFNFLQVTNWVILHITFASVISLRKIIIYYTRNTCMQQPLATKSMQLYFRNYMKYLYRLLS